ncbi:MAG: Coenzyme F420 hydrogenase/dehydrogenase, beta subunit C-terminal domain, partial [Peptococcaceae bacterium]|nr:Coenzyme F420 hydrogenase/dehydrogenase, beta subunit C-terminal domain [Peptococcaceae bacterium]
MGSSSGENCGGAAGLRSKVLGPGLCTVCGACAGHCPYIKAFGEQVAVVHDCGIRDGVCCRVCPRGGTDYGLLRQAVTGGAEFDPVLGTHSALYFARAGDEVIRSRGQYGGVVTALAFYARQQGLIDCALTAGGGPAGALPALCQSPQDIVDTAGSKYTAVPTLSLFHEAVRKGFQEIGVVGRPCQATAARKMQQVEEIGGRRIALVIGLFCFWALSAEFYP